ncbi:ATP phosphoribosyltransferase regulatory subunit [Oceaniserpentilla sp. 4NH20-0058]|uniref:ATP phosphoribosyltransferase regulatory subunit n=1 Tax=Oceaniserpentilla sp. 4NH20-0058 TaxID=3127660 RepID=UPI003108D4DE
MNQADRWLLPDGIEELLPPEAKQLEAMRRTLLDTFSNWGYELVVPPQLEFLESLLTGVGSDLNLQTFKVTDQLTGRLMGVSADITPQVARIDAHSWAKEGINRLSYCGSVLHTRAKSLLSSRAPMQVGAELFGESGPCADVEILSLMVESMQRAGLDNIHLDIGHVGIYKALVAQAELSAEAEQQIFENLNNKSVTEYQLLVQQYVKEPKLQQAFISLLTLNGSTDVIEQAQVLEDVADVASSLANLNEICSTLQSRFAGVDIFIDLAELRGFDYHTGIVFAAYVAGHGQAVAQGGRYDDTGAVFGRARAATGFSADIKQWVRIVNKQVSTEDGIFAPVDADWSVVSELRSQGKRVISGLSNTDDPAAIGCTSVLVFKNDQWIVETL